MLLGNYNGEENYFAADGPCEILSVITQQVLGGGGGGGGGGFFANSIFNEAAGNIEDTSVTLTWNTSLASTGRVVYDLVPHPGLGSAPNYGYAFSTSDSGVLALAHAMGLAGLTPGTTYYFRAVANGVPEVISVTEHQFNTSLTGPVGPVGGSPDGEGGGTTPPAGGSGGGTGGPTEPPSGGGGTEGTGGGSGETGAGGGEETGGQTGGETGGTGVGEETGTGGGEENPPAGGDADLGANAAGAGDFLSALAGLFDFSTYWWFWLLLLLLLLWWFFIWRRRDDDEDGEE